MEIRFGRRDTHSEQQTKKKAGGKSEEKIFFLYEKQWSCSIGQGETKHFKKKKKLFGKHHQLHKQRRALEHKKNYSILCNL